MSISESDDIIQQYAELRRAHDEIVQPDEWEVVRLYRDMLNGWNARSAERMAAPFAADGELIGFDGSEAAGRQGIHDHAVPIFAHHKTPRYVAIVQAVKLLTPKAAILRAYSGLVSEGAAESIRS